MENVQSCNSELDNHFKQLYLDLLKQSLTASLYEESGWQIMASASDPSQRSWRKPLHLIWQVVRDWVARLLYTRKVLLVEERPLDMGLREEGRDWPYFGYTMAGHRRLENVQQCVEDVLQRAVPGDLIETGVWRGGMTIFMRALLKAHSITDRTVWVADSFQGLPAPSVPQDQGDLSQASFLKISQERVQENFKKFDLLDEQVQFIPGWFSDTLPTAPPQQLAILRIDCDLYSSTMDVLTNLYDRVSPGGYVIVDDYYSWPECRQAVTEFLAERQLNVEIIQIDWTGAYWQV